MSTVGVRVGVGTRFRYDGETVEVTQMVATGAGMEVLLADGRGRVLRVSLRELLFSDRARIIADGSGPTATDDEAFAGVVLDQLTDRQRREMLHRAEHVREVLTHASDHATADADGLITHAVRSIAGLDEIISRVHRRLVQR